jgi:hypothetical protein
MTPASFQIALTPSQLDALVTAHLGAGATYPDSGTLPETKGVVLGYSINRASAVTAIVTFTVIKKPWIATVGMIESTVKQMVGMQ